MNSEYVSGDDFSFAKFASDANNFLNGIMEYSCKYVTSKPNSLYIVEFYILTLMLEIVYNMCWERKEILVSQIYKSESKGK